MRKQVNVYLINEPLHWCYNLDHYMTIIFCTLLDLQVWGSLLLADVG